MTGSEALHCQGAPRDLGRSQGQPHADAIRRALAREGFSTRRSRWPNWRPLASGPVLGRGPGREIIRHYPHHGERLAGMALAAGVPLASLVAKNAREMSRDSALGAKARCVAVPGESVRLVREMHGGLAADESYLVRRSIPEVGFASVELTKPWFVSAFAGINEHGLAVVLQAPLEAGAQTDLTATLLVQDCLQRFTTVAACVDWCSKRPSQGASRLGVADPSGDRAQIAPGGAEASPWPPDETGHATSGQRGSGLEVRLEPDSRRLSFVSFPDGVETASFVAGSG